VTDDDETRDECGPGSGDGREAASPPEAESGGAEGGRADTDEVTEIPIGVPISDAERRAMKEAAQRHDDAPDE
jgi:hypothetical protein